MSRAGRMWPCATTASKGSRHARDRIQHEGAGEETVIDTPLVKLGPFLVRLEPLVAVRPLS
jgi:hypothetical protein